MSMRDDEIWTPVLRGSVSDLVSNQILSIIKSEKLKPGDRLPSERDLSQMLNVARPSLREALRSLQARGKLEIRHGSGVYVAEPQTEQEIRASVYAEEVSLEELYEMREVLEVPAARWASQRADSDRIAAIETALSNVTAEELSGEPDWQHLRRLDAEFHLSIVQAAGNRFLTSVQDVLHTIINTGMQNSLMQPGRLDEASMEHRDIFDAIKNGDSARAVNAVQIHIRQAKSAAIAQTREEAPED